MENVLTFLTIAKRCSLKYRQGRENRKLFFNQKYASQLRCDRCISRFSHDCVKIRYRDNLRKGWRKGLLWPRVQGFLHRGWRVTASGVWGSWLRCLTTRETDTHEGWVLSAQYPLYSVQDPKSIEWWCPLSWWAFTAQLTLPRNTRLDTTTGGFSRLFYIQTW